MRLAGTTEQPATGNRPPATRQSREGLARAGGSAAGRRSPVAGVLSLLFLSSCGKTMTDAECERVGKHMRAVWDADVDASAPEVKPADNERAKLVIKGEGDRLEREWMAQCRRDLEGRQVDPKEVACILRGKTIADIQACGAMKKP
jgi:hypothetical protein